MMIAKRDLLKESVVALVVVLLHFSQQIGAFLKGKNRHYMHWEFADGLALVLDVVFLAILAVAVNRLLYALRWQRALRLYHHVFLLALVSGIFSNLPFWWCRAKCIEIAWLGVMAVIGYSYANVQSRLVNYGRNLCLIISPLVPILFYQILVVVTWGTSPEPRPEFKSSNQAANPVYFFVFDYWSYSQSTQGGEFHPYFQNLRKLCDQSFNFRQAHSLGTSTHISVPAIIFQTDQEMQIENDQAIWLFEGSPTTSAEVPSLFQLAREHDYHTALLGFYLPYRKILGDQVDYCHSYPHDPKGNSLIGKMLYSAVRTLQYFKDPVCPRLGVRLNNWIFNKHWFEINDKILQESLWQIAHSPDNMFTFYHWPLPHRPYVFTPDGNYQDPPKSMEDETLADYQVQLQYLDQVIGRILQQLRTSGKFDDALIIITSDHSGPAYEPNATDEEASKHIPLIVKLPRQKSAHVIDQPFSNYRLKPIIEAVLRGNVDEQGMLQLINHSVADSVDHQSATR